MNNEMRALYLALNDRAYEITGSPDYEPVLPPPPEDKSPGALIHAWGIEMCRVGFELALSLFEGDSENEDKTD